MTQPKIKLLIPIEIIPEKGFYDLVNKEGKIEEKHDFDPNDRMDMYYLRDKFSYWIKETDLTIDELKKIGVIK